MTPRDDVTLTACTHTRIKLGPVIDWSLYPAWRCVACDRTLRDDDCPGRHGRQRQTTSGWQCVDCGRVLLPPSGDAA